jgi:signal transduction histidine kinase
VQEALTNAARHGSGPADVNIGYRDHELELNVSNPIEAADNGATVNRGHGILGMRERAALLGGSLQAGPSHGRFRIHARLPRALAETRR